jgi:type IV pilus assembly protein PilA
MTMNANKGFSLVEIMVVVMIIGMITAIGIPSFVHVRTEARKNTCIANLKQLNSAVQQYVMEQNTTNMPPNISPVLDIYFQTRAPTNGPAGGTYTLPIDGDHVPECSQYSTGHWIREG